MNKNSGILCPLNSGEHQYTDKCCDKIYDKITRLAQNLVKTGEDIEKIYRNDTQYYATFLDSNGYYFE